MMVSPGHDCTQPSAGFSNLRTVVAVTCALTTIAVGCASSDGNTSRNGNGLNPSSGGSGAGSSGGGAVAGGSAGATPMGTGGVYSGNGGGGMPSGNGGGAAPSATGGGSASGNGGVGVPNGGAGAAPAGGGVPGGGGAPGGGGGGVSTGGAPVAGGFPRGDMVNTDQKGPYMTAKYTEGLDNPTYASSVMYYPTDASPPYASAVFSPGFTATKENYETFLGPLLASHGIAILLTTPTTTGDLPQQRAEDLQAAVAQIAKENTRDGSPLKGKLATDRVCVTGHSMGGGGTLWAATTLGTKIRCAVPLQPWQPGQSFAMIKAPTLFIAAQSDSIAAVAQNAQVFYNSIPSPVPKYYAEFTGASHFLTTNDLGTAYDVQSKYMIAFYKVYLEDDMRYMSVLTGAADPKLSAYKHAP